MRRKRRSKREPGEKKKRRRGKAHGIVHKFQGLPMTEKEKRRRIKILKREYLEGNWARFTRKHTKRYWYELVYSKTLPKWRRENPVAVNWLLENCKWPKHVVEVANIMYTLEKEFDWAITKKNMLIAYTIWDYLWEDLEKRMHKKYVKSITEKLRELSHYKPTEDQAFKEQKARGFIHKSDFSNYRSKKHHVYSNVDNDYIYPMNFGMSYKDQVDKLLNVYIGHNLVGVRGYTIAQINESVLHKN